MKTPFPDPLLLEDAGMRGGSRVFRLAKSFSCRTSYGMVIVPVGFETDGASIPKIFHSIIGPFGGYFPAALLHDFLYSTESATFYHFEREDADSLFLEAMFNLQVPWWTRHTIHAAVRAFGWRYYRKP